MKSILRGRTNYEEVGDDDDDSAPPTNMSSSFVRSRTGSATKSPAAKHALAGITSGLAPGQGTGSGMHGFGTPPSTNASGGAFAGITSGLTPGHGTGSTMAGFGSPPSTTASAGAFPDAVIPESSSKPNQKSKSPAIKHALSGLTSGLTPTAGGAGSPMPGFGCPATAIASSGEQKSSSWALPAMRQSRNRSTSPDGIDANDRIREYTGGRASYGGGSFGSGFAYSTGSYSASGAAPGALGALGAAVRTPWNSIGGGSSTATAGQSSGAGENFLDQDAEGRSQSGKSWGWSAPNRSSLPDPWASAVGARSAVGSAVGSTVGSWGRGSSHKAMPLLDEEEDAEQFSGPSTTGAAAWTRPAASPRTPFDTRESRVSSSAAPFAVPPAPPNDVGQCGFNANSQASIRSANGAVSRSTSGQTWQKSVGLQPVSPQVVPRKSAEDLFNDAIIEALGALPSAALIEMLRSVRRTRPTEVRLAQRQMVDANLA